MEEWLTENKLPIGKGIDSAIRFIQDHAAWAFDIFTEGLEVVIEGLIDALTWVPPLLLVALLAGGAFALHRSWKLTAVIVGSLLLVINLGYWEATIETLALIIFATGVCMLVGVPLGIAAAHRPWLFTLLRPVLDLMQTIPTFVYLIPTLILFGLGVVPGLISTVIFAIPAPIRQHGKQFVDAIHLARYIALGGVGAHPEVLLDGELAEHTPTLQNLGDPPAHDRRGRSFVDRLAVQADLTLRDVAVVHVEQP